jgi:hypothetical protein
MLSAIAGVIQTHHFDSFSVLGSIKFKQPDNHPKIMTTKEGDDSNDDTNQNAEEASTSNGHGKNKNGRSRSSKGGGGNKMNEAYARPSISIRMIRHAESRNNQVYRDARRLYKLGTDDNDVKGWEQYVTEHRRSDPDLSEIGILQAAALADYLVPLLSSSGDQQGAARLTDLIVSPMRRTLATIRPTAQALRPLGCKMIVHGFYFETEGCHTNGVAEEGMNPTQIEHYLFPTKEEEQVVPVAVGAAAADTTGSSSSSPPSSRSPSSSSTSWIDAVGFPNDPTRGWWTRDGSETRAMAEDRAAQFYLWLCEHLDEQLANPDGDVAGIYDAGVAVEDEDNDKDDDAHHAAGNGQHTSHRQRQQQQRHRKTTVLMGHGDFMSLVLKRIVGGFGHAVEMTGVPHRSAFVHWNTGITELEYFGQGRFLVMAVNATPHLMTATADCSSVTAHSLLTGGSLKDGWSFLMPHDHDDNPRVTVVFSDQELDGAVVEQKAALKALYLSSHTTIGNGEDGTKKGNSIGEDGTNGNGNNTDNYSVEESDNGDESSSSSSNKMIHHFVVRQGFQVVGVATYAADTGRVFDVAVRPSASQNATSLLFNAGKDYAKRHGRSGSLRVQPRTETGRRMFEAVGFRHSQSYNATTANPSDEEEASHHMEYLH